MSEWLEQGFFFVVNKTWYAYYGIASYYIDRGYDLTNRKISFLKDFILIIISSTIISLLVTTIITLIYKKKYNTKLLKKSICKVFLFIFFISFFKWELILLSPLVIISYCILYLIYQENNEILKNLKKYMFIIYTSFVFYFIFTSLWLMSEKI